MSSSKRAPPKKKEPPSCPAWMMTFGDSMSLLVTFFVMMIAFSSLEEAKLAAMVGVLRGAFGAVDVRMSEGAVESMAITDVDKSIPDSRLDHAIRGESPDLRFLTAEEMADALPDFINEIRQHSADVLSDRLLIQILDEGLSIILQTTDIFEKGSTELTQDCQPLWQGIASLLLGRNNDLRITSVTSASAPVQASVAATSWGLGIARSDIIARNLQVAMKSPPTRFGIGVQVYDDDNSSAGDDNVEIMILERGNVLDVGPEQSWPKGVWR